MTSTALSDWALGLASDLLEKELPTRWQHVQAAVAKARRFAPAVPGDEEMLIAAVALHDAGFASAAHKSGFSTLDAAWYIRSAGAPARLVDLVAHQAVGSVEAELRGLREHYSEFGPDEASPVRDAMWTCCVTSTPDGGDCTVRERCEGWRVRYPFGWLQEYFDRCQPELEAAERRTLDRMASDQRSTNVG